MSNLVTCDCLTAASKVACDGSIHVWSLSQSKKRQKEGTKEVTINPLYTLEWCDSDSVYLDIGTWPGKKCLKPLYSFGKFGKYWKWKKQFCNGFCLWSFMSSKSLVNWFVWNHQYFEKFAKIITLLGCPRKFYHRFMHITPSSVRSLVNLNVPFKLILKRFEIIFWCLEREWCTFEKIDGNSLKSTNSVLFKGNVMRRCKTSFAKQHCDVSVRALSL